MFYCTFSFEKRYKVFFRKGNTRLGNKGRKEEEEKTHTKKIPTKKRYFDTHAKPIPHKKRKEREKGKGGKYDTSRHPPHIKMMLIASSLSPPKIFFPFLLPEGGKRKGKKWFSPYLFLSFSLLWLLMKHALPPMFFALVAKTRQRNNNANKTMPFLSLSGFTSISSSTIFCGAGISPPEKKLSHNFC